MRKYLDIPKIDYVLTHLKFRCDFPVELSRRLVFLKQEELGAIPQNCVVFPLSNQKRSVNHKIGQLPIFYPVLKKESSHIVKSNDSLLFSHDILQEIFCLQTLYYEQEVNDKDKLGRIRPEST